MTLGEKIKLLRAERALSQKELGKKAGVDQRQISRYESGEVEPTLRVIGKIAGIFGVTVDSLISEDGKSDGKGGVEIKDRELAFYLREIDRFSKTNREAVKYVLKGVVMMGEKK